MDYFFQRCQWKKAALRYMKSPSNKADIDREVSSGEDSRWRSSYDARRAGNVPPISRRVTQMPRAKALSICEIMTMAPVILEQNFDSWVTRRGCNTSWMKLSCWQCYIKLFSRCQGAVEDASEKMPQAEKTMTKQKILQLLCSDTAQNLGRQTSK